MTDSVTVAIIAAYSSTTMESDAIRYFGHYGEQGFAEGQFTQVLPTSYHLQGPCDKPSWQIEEALDVESVHGLAPGAAVTYVAARSCSYQDLLTPLNTIVNGHLADIVSNSWGLFNEGEVPTSWLQADHAVVEPDISAVADPYIGYKIGLTYPGYGFTTSYSGSLCYTTCLVTDDRDTTLTTAFGYDDVTGLGTPNGLGFLNAVRSGG